MRRVLVVDDEHPSRFAIAAVLRQAGFETVEADSGLAALHILEHDADFAVILSDVQMPRMDGMRLLAELGRRHAVIPVVVISGLARHATEARALGAACYLPKPFSKYQLVETIRTASRGIAQVT
jgi:CheY-like chemotaxis protein